jgi:hypothetical protein
VREGIRVAAWDFLFYSLIGVVITFAVRIGGVVVVFAFLIIPATISAIFSARLIPRLLLTWGAGILGALLGLLFAHRLDFSVGPAVALFLGVELALAGLTARTRPLVGGVVTALVAVAYVVLLANAPACETTSPVAGDRDISAAVEPAPEHLHHVEHPHAGEASLPSIEDLTDPGELASRFEGAPDAGSRSEIVSRTLEVEPRCGAFLALRFLEEDPPIFFRQMVADALEARSSEPLGFDPMRPPGEEGNRVALERLRRAFRLDDAPRPCGGGDD